MGSYDKNATNHAMLALDRQSFIQKIYMKLFSVFYLAKEHHDFAFLIEYLNFAAILICPCLASKNIPCTQRLLALGGITLTNHRPQKLGIFPKISLSQQVDKYSTCNIFMS